MRNPPVTMLLKSTTASRRRPWALWTVPGLALLLLVLAVPRAADTATGLLLLPHVARYTLSRHRADPDSGVAAVKGMMEVRLEISCDGYRIDQYLGFHVLGDDESQLEHLAYLSSFEDAPGKEFYFEAKTFENRRLTEELSGRATVEDTGSGQIRYTLPEAVTETLPKDTVFPIKHLELIIEAARKGQKGVRHTVFDGSTRENPFEVSSFIGPAADGNSKRMAALNGSTYWPVRLAYFKIGALSLAPEFEMSAEVFDNGVVGDMIYDYGNFAIDVKLEEVEALKKPEC